MSQLNKVAGTVVDAALEALRSQIERAGVESRQVLLEASADLERIALDLVDGRLSLQLAEDLCRKRAVTLESRLARIGRAEARAYVATVLRLIFGAIADQLSAVDQKFPG